MTKILKLKTSRVISYLLLFAILSLSSPSLYAQEKAEKRSKIDKLIEELKKGGEKEKLPEEKLPPKPEEKIEEKIPEVKAEPEEKIEEKEKPLVAILDLEPITVDEGTTRVLSGYLRTQLFKTGEFTVVTREDMDTILKEQGFQQTGFCTQTECAIEVGQLLGTEKLFTGSLGKVGDTFSTTLKLFDVQTGKMERSETELCKGCSEDELFGSAENLAKKMVGVAITTALVGSLCINVYPWADIYIDGKSYGPTPLKIFEIASGKHLLVLKRSNFPDIVKTIEIEPAKTLRIKDKFEK